jgi:hypothetical protein
MPFEVKVGSRWEIKDRREAGRVVRVLSTDERYAYCEAVGSERRTRILLTSLRRRFREVSDAS